MNDFERAPKAVWYRPKLRRYAIKERPKSWAYGNYRKLDQLGEDVEGSIKNVSRQSMPPAPPLRSPFTRLQTIQTLPEIEPRGDIPTVRSEASEKRNETTDSQIHILEASHGDPHQEENGAGNGIQQQETASAVHGIEFKM